MKLSTTEILFFISLFVVGVCLLCLGGSQMAQNRQITERHEEVISDLTMQFVSTNSAERKEYYKREMCKVARNLPDKDIPENLWGIVGRCKED